MTRLIPGAVGPELTKIYTESTWLIRIITVAGESPSQTIRASTRGAVSWNGESWLALGFRVEGSVRQDSFKFSWPNEDGGVFALAADGSLRRATADIYVMYPGASDAVHYMQGFVASVTGLMTNRVEVIVDRFQNDSAVVPSIQIGPPGWTMLPPSDLEFEWAGRLVTLEQKSG